MKIKFLAFSYTKPFSFNPVAYWLRSFYKKNGKHYGSYTWLPTEYFYDEHIVNRIVAESPDILCLSVYLWNFESLMKVAREVSIKKPEINIVVGGPECHAHSEPDWFDRYPFVDFAIYGDGENAFAKLLDWWADPQETPYSSIPNIVDEVNVSKHEIFKFKDWEPYSPYLDLSSEFLKEYNLFKNKVNGQFVYLPYERARGCMYSCAFCDWQGGLHYKVNSRINDYKPEIDFFVKNKIRSMHIDANVGMLKEDIPLYEYVYEKMQENSLEFIPTEPRNMAKLNKEKVARIYDLLCRASPKYSVKVSLQSIYDDVLSYIDRPDVPWEKHKLIIKKTRNDHPGITVIPELIMGLPGMTFDRINETHLEFTDIPMSYIFSYEWILLKKAPAYSEAYRKRNGLITTKVFYPAIFTGENYDAIAYSDFIKDPSIPINKSQAYYIDMVYDSAMGIKGVIYHKMITRVYNRMAPDPVFSREWLARYLDTHSPFLIDAASKEAAIQEEFYALYGFYMWGKCDSTNNRIGNYEETLDMYIDHTLLEK
jgi:radical SAM superfamily enzyme YgiQ (UPF0313 family)